MRVPSFLSKMLKGRDTSGPAAPGDRQTVPGIELKGRLLEYYVKPIVEDLHRRTPKGLKYLKEACSK